MIVVALPQMRKEQLTATALSPSYIDLYWIWSTTYSHLTRRLTPKGTFKDSLKFIGTLPGKENEWGMAHSVPKGNFSLAKSQRRTATTPKYWLSFFYSSSWDYFYGEFRVIKPRENNDIEVNVILKVWETAINTKQ